MCLAVAGKLIERDGNSGTVDVRGNRVRTRLDVVPEATVGDFLLVHAGLAITVISEDDARATDEAFDEFEEIKRADASGQ